MINAKLGKFNLNIANGCLWRGSFQHQKKSFTFCVFSGQFSGQYLNWPVYFKTRWLKIKHNRLPFSSQAISLLHDESIWWTSLIQLVQYNNLRWLIPLFLKIYCDDVTMFIMHNFPYSVSVAQSFVQHQWTNQWTMEESDKGNPIIRKPVFIWALPEQRFDPPFCTNSDIL